MLFGVSFCRRKAVKRKTASHGAGLRICLAVIAALLAVLLLFLAPHWLLVLLVVLLAAAVALLIARLK